MKTAMTAKEQCQFNLAMISALTKKNAARIERLQKKANEVPDIFHSDTEMPKWSDLEPMPTKVVKEYIFVRAFNSLLTCVGTQIRLKSDELAVSIRQPSALARIQIEIQEQVSNMHMADSKKAIKVLGDLSSNLLGDFISFNTAIGWTKVSNELASSKYFYNKILIFKI